MANNNNRLNYEGDTKEENAFYALAEKIRRLREQSEYFRDLLRQRPPGRYKNATVYAVRGHQVKAHWREGWTAVRLRQPSKPRKV